MLRARVIPCLLLRGESLVKTVKFGKHEYIGDPINTVRIFNQLEVDELAFLDIDASREGKPPHYELLAQIADECFMPLSYGGGIRTAEEAKRIFGIGFEKVVVNSSNFESLKLIEEIARFSGSQSVIAAVDHKKTLFGGPKVFSHGGTRKQSHAPVEWAQQIEAAGAGELLVNSMDRDGTWSGFDLELLKQVTDAVHIPVIACGGAGKVEHIFEAVQQANCSAVALGSMVVFQERGMGVLINFPSRAKLKGL